MIFVTPDQIKFILYNCLILLPLIPDQREDGQEQSCGTAWLPGARGQVARQLFNFQIQTETALTGGPGSGV